MWGLILSLIFLRPFISGHAFETIDLVMSLLFIFIGLLYIYLKRENFKKTPLDKLIILFLISIIISLFFSSNLLNSLSKFYKYLYLVVLFYVVKLSNGEKRKILLMIIIISGTLVAIYSLRFFFVVSKYILSYLAQSNIDYYFAKEFLTRKRAFAPFVSPNLLAIYLVMLLFISSSIFLESLKLMRGGLGRLLSCVYIIISLVVLFLTKSIGGWLSLFLSFLIILILNKRIDKRGAFIVLIIFLFFISVFILRLRGRGEITKPLYSLKKRISYWQETVNIIRLHPLVGVGLGNFSLRESETAHNSYLQIWAEIGILGLISWLGMVFIFLRGYIGKIKSAQNKIYSLGLLAGGLSFLLHNLIDFSFFVPQASFLWWIILALGEN